MNNATKRLYVVKTSDCSYRVDIDYCDENGKIFEVKKGKEINYNSVYKIPTGSFRPILLEFINNVDNLHYENNTVTGISNGEVVSFNFPKDFINDEFVRNSISKKEREKKLEDCKIIESNIDTVSIFNFYNMKFELKIVYKDGTEELKEVPFVTGIVRTIIIPLIEEIWGMGNQLNYSIESSTVIAKENGKLFYQIDGKNKTKFKIEINDSFFDINGIGAIETTLGNGNCDAEKLHKIASVIKENKQKVFYKAQYTTPFGRI